MRLPLCLCLTFGLSAGEPALPGRDALFLAKILGDDAGGSQPWRAFKPPQESGSAVVEVVGELSPEELRQATFQEFLAWFREDLRRFLRGHGGYLPATSLASATLPVDRFGGNPVPRNVPLGQAQF